MGQPALLELLDDLGARAGRSVLFRTNGEWSVPPERFDRRVRALAAALAGFGLPAGGRVAVLGEEGHHTLVAHLGVLAAGGALVPLDPGRPPESIRAAIEASGATHAIASDETRLATILRLRPDLPSLEMVLLMSAAPSERKPAALLAETAMQMGEARLQSDPELLRRAVAAEGASGAAVVIAGESGAPRVVTRGALAALCATTGDALGLGAGRGVLLDLRVERPERLAIVLAAAGRGGTVLLAAEGRPDAGLGAHPPVGAALDPRALARLSAAWDSDLAAQSWLRRRVAGWALRHGQGPDRGWKHRAADALVLRGLRARLGGRLTSIHVPAGSRRPERATALLSAVGIELKELPGPQDPGMAR